MGTEQQLQSLRERARAMFREAMQGTADSLMTPEAIDAAARAYADRILAPLSSERERARTLPSGLIVSAVRYALGRSTYVVGETCAYLREHWQEIPEGHREVILRDIREEMERDGGMECDRREWARVLALASAPPVDPGAP